ncbi:opacity protein-like surface antigen [Elusimicrobium posterum]|uniref:outer membrane beta-barrel protein n=1 Tax=Elusimicrobium posterum TaxID=3116653 RepID=UPI003C77B2B0
MKKTCVLLVLMFAALGVFAQDYGGIGRNENRIGVYGGISAPTDLDFDHDKVGRNGPSFGVEFLRTASPRFSMGMEGFYAYYGEHGIRKNRRSKGSIYSGHVLGRVNFMYDEPTRFYIPFGLGLSRYKQELNNGIKESESGISMFTGLGMEFDVSSRMVLGIEGRYMYMPLDSDNFTDSFFTSLSFLIKAGFKF